MPEKETIQRAKRAKASGKSASTQAGEFVREEIHHVREGKHGAKSSKQAIAIGLSKARRAGVKLAPPKKGSVSEDTRRKSAQDTEKGRHAKSGGSRSSAKTSSVRRSRATTGALKREGRAAASSTALSRQAHGAAKRRTPGDRSAAARKAARTKGPAARSAAAKKAARTRAANRRHAS